MVDKRALGQRLDSWVPPQLPGPNRLSGRYTTLERLNADLHAADLFQALGEDTSLWEYLFSGPFTSAASFHRWVRDCTANPDLCYFAIRDLSTGTCTGMAAYLHISPKHGSIEVGGLCFSRALQRTRAATEAMYLMMKWVFEAGYRRCEWKCNALNLPSRRAAQRLGFSYEGVFRQASVVKGRNRDTAGFAVIDKEWPALSEAYLAWLASSNFTDKGKQREALSDLTRLVRGASDPMI